MLTAARPVGRGLVTARLDGSTRFTGSTADKNFVDYDESIAFPVASDEQSRSSGPDRLRGFFAWYADGYNECNWMFASFDGRCRAGCTF
jgi:hypothetical protein